MTKAASATSDTASQYLYYLWKFRIDCPDSWSYYKEHAESIIGQISSGEDVLLSLETGDVVDRITIAACGTSYYAGMVGKYYFEQFASLPSEIEQAAEMVIKKTRSALVLNKPAGLATQGGKVGASARFGIALRPDVLS